MILLTRKPIRFKLLNLRNYAEQKFQLPVSPYKLFKLDHPPASTAFFTRSEAIDWYRKMQIIRNMEKQAAGLYRKKICRGFLHLYSGQEAIAVGIHSMLRKDDKIVMSYRCHSWMYLTLNDPVPVLKELAGYRTGAVRGKGGSVHQYGGNFYGGHGIVGAQVPLGTGLAFAEHYRRTKNIVVVGYGDGCANQGQVFEAFNMAKLYNLPCFFLCENNIFGMGTSDVRASANPHFYTRGDYIPGLLADGMCVLSMRNATEYAIEYITAGKGPIIVEAKTYRYFGHSMSDPATSYRKPEDVQKVRETIDPIKTFRRRLIEAGVASQEELLGMKKNIAKEVQMLRNKVEKTSEFPHESELGLDVYSNNLVPAARGTNYWTPVPISTLGKARNLK